MKATDTEIWIVNNLRQCSFLPGSFDKKLSWQIDLQNISPLQQYYIYKLGYKYRKQIGNDALTTICKNYIDSHQEPMSRKDSQKLIKKAITTQTPIGVDGIKK